MSYEVNTIELAREIALGCFGDYVELISPEFKIAEHHGSMIHFMEDLIEQKNSRGIIKAPPRHSKTSLASNLLPSYAMTKWRDFHAVVATYGHELSIDIGRRTKNIFTSELYQKIFPDVRMSEDSSAKTRFHISNDSSFFSVGVGGALTGKSASLLVLDDAYKNKEEARSKNYQQKLRDWYSGTFFTRRLPGAPVLLVNTLWTVGDIALELQQRDPESWRSITLQAIKEDGTALWPEMFPIEELLQIKRTMGSQMFNAVYQQNPAPEEGALVKRSWWKFYKQPPQSFEFMGISCDLTFKEGPHTDYVCMGVWGRNKADKYLLDQIRARMSFTDTLTAFKALCGKWPRASAKWVEDAANGAALVDTLRKHISGIIPVKPMGSKIARASAVAPQIESGNVYLPDPSIAPWVNDYIEEWVAFPDSQNDDQVDQSSMALMKLSEGLTSGWQPMSLTGASKWLK